MFLAWFRELNMRKKPKTAKTAKLSRKKKRARPGYAKRRYNSEGIDQYGATRKGPQEDAL